MKNKVSDGDRIGLVCPYATITSGQAILVGALFGIAIFDGVAGDVIVADIEGEFTITALSTDVAAAGALAYWDDTNRRITVTSTGNTLVGTFTAAKADAETTAQVRLLSITSAASPDIATGTTVTVTAAQVKALNATPKEIIAAPGAGKALILEDAELFLDYGSAAYAGIASNEDLQLRYTNGSGQLIATVEATGFLDLTADAYRFVRPTGEITPPANAAIVLCMSTGEVITGDSPIKVRPRYRTVTLLT